MSISVRYSESLVPEGFPFATATQNHISSPVTWRIAILEAQIVASDSPKWEVKGSKNQEIMPA